MRKIILAVIVVLLLATTTASCFGGNDGDNLKITFRNGKEIVGYYFKIGSQYCQDRYGGVVCINDAEVVNITSLKAASNQAANKKK